MAVRNAKCEIIMLEVTKEEKEKVMMFLKDNNMMQCIMEKKTERIRKTPSKKVKNTQDDICGRGGSGDNGDGGNPEPQQDDLEDGQCPFCFIRPCIANSNNAAPWLGNGQPPSNANPQIRKTIYRRFWKCINNVYGWLLPQYIAKKRRIGGGEWVVMHQREIMPECVLELVRSLYPNPEGVPYLGHTWE